MFALRYVFFILHTTGRGYMYSTEPRLLACREDLQHIDLVAYNVHVHIYIYWLYNPIT